MLRIMLIIVTLILFNVKVSYAHDVTYRGLGVKRDDYHTELLKLIFEHIPNNIYQAKRYPTEIPHQRAFQFLEAGEAIDIVIGYATNERIDKYQAIPIPIMKGLNGWRISVIHQDNIDMFKEVKTLAQLQKYTPGLFHSWTDNKIFAANKIITLKGSDFNGLFYMLDKKRFDYFPLSLLEIERELAIYTKEYQLNLIAEPHIIVNYPVCFYFYVKKGNKTLSDNITAGFETIIANGKFDLLFDKFHGEKVNGFMSENRQIIKLANPLLPKSVPINREELWLH